ncbi:MAG: hypothetical protein PHH14_06985 [Candidatus Margulisbacteria bacterium]|nr:hypothetical protein [Candidatus Margulisiibacteriota bacterium]
MNKEGSRLDGYRRTAVIFVAIVTMILSFLIVRPFMIAILSAAALSYIFYPVYLSILRFLPKKVRAKEIGAIATVLLIILIVLIPVSFVTVFLSLELKSGYLFLQQFLSSPQIPQVNLPSFLGQWSGYLPQLKEVTAELIPLPKLSIFPRNTFSRI